MAVLYKSLKKNSVSSQPSSLEKNRTQLFFESIDDEVVINAKEVCLSPGVPRDESCIDHSSRLGLLAVKEFLS